MFHKKKEAFGQQSEKPRSPETALPFSEKAPLNQISLSLLHRLPPSETDSSNTLFRFFR